MSDDLTAFLLITAAGTLLLAALALVGRALRDAPWVEPYDDAWDQRDRTWIDEWEQARTPEATAERMAARVGRRG